MSISGTITCHQLACPSHDDNNDSKKSSINIIITCYRINDNQRTLTTEAFLLKHNKPVVTITCTAIKSEAQVNDSHRTQAILYTCDYTIDSLSSGIYSVFAYEDCEEAQGLLIHPQKQAFGWSASEVAGKWTQHIIYNSNTNIINANITLRKPHSFFAVGYPVKTDTARFHTVNQIPVLQLNATTPADRGYSHGYLLAPHILDWFYSTY